MNSYCFLYSPIGRLTLCSDGAALTGLYMQAPSEHPSVEGWREDPAASPLREAATQLAEYFSGKRTTFELPLCLRGTEFQRRVWNALTEIPFGETRTYGQLARHIGNPAACRAVGLANARNPICVIVPCHRVIGADGSLTGFGGGLPRKEWLLRHERPVENRTLELALAQYS
jgi:methylated-DNA-[protein]-cysteine S-methyltransferase